MTTPFPLLCHPLPSLSARSPLLYHPLPSLSIPSSFTSSSHSYNVHQTGVLISKLNPLSKANGILQKDDILMKIDDHPIANDGTIVFRNRMSPIRSSPLIYFTSPSPSPIFLLSVALGERIMFNYLLSQKFVGDEVKVTVHRDSKVSITSSTSRYSFFKLLFFYSFIL